MSWKIIYNFELYIKQYYTRPTDYKYKAIFNYKDKIPNSNRSGL